MAGKFAGKTALVTGASKGIGRGIALELAEQGADVVVNYASSAGEAESLCAEIQALGQRAIAVKANVGDRAAVEAMFDAAVKEFGRLDVVVSNAAYSVRKPLLELEVQDVADTWAVSLWGVFHSCQLAARQMVKQGGNGAIVVISSVHAGRPYANASAYNGAKAAINHMAATWAVELAPHRIRVNVIEPGWTDTPGERMFYSEADIVEQGRKLPWGRLGYPSEIGKAVAFLASDDAEYITGSALRVDGAFALVR